MKVNFVTEITAFYRWVKSNYISSNAQLLWFQLFCLWNEAGFPEYLQVDTQRLMGMIQVSSKNTLYRARDELIQAGLLKLFKGKHKTPHKYQFVLFAACVEKMTSTATGSNSEPKTASKRNENEPLSGRLYKLNQMKPNLNKEKAVYGEFGNVLLSSVEIEKLQNEYPDTWEEWIRRLDMGKEMKGYQYTNDYAAILNWIEKEEREKTEQVFQELMAELQ